MYDDINAELFHKSMQIFQKTFLSNSAAHQIVDKPPDIADKLLDTNSVDKPSDIADKLLEVVVIPIEYVDY